MKKVYWVLVIAICFIMILGLVGCGNNDEKKTQDIKEALTGRWAYTDSKWISGMFAGHEYYFNQKNNMDYCLKRFMATESDLSDLFYLDDDENGSFMIDLKESCIVLTPNDPDSDRTSFKMHFDYENGGLTLDGYEKIE